MLVKTKRIKRYSKSFKQDLVKKVASGVYSCKEACTVYGIGHSSLNRWSREFGVNVVEYIDVPLEGMKKEDKPLVQEAAQADAPASLSEDVSELQQQIVQLQQQLQRMLMRAEVAELTIEIAERDLGLDIRKKSAAKSSPK